MLSDAAVNRIGNSQCTAAHARVEKIIRRNRVCDVNARVCVMSRYELLMKEDQITGSLCL